MSSSEQSHDRSDLWQSQRDDIEANGGDWRDHRETVLRGLDINILRKVAAEAEGVIASGSQSELASRLADANCFRGPVGDETIYQERAGDAVPLVSKRGVIGSMRYMRVQTELAEESQQED